MISPDLRHVALHCTAFLHIRSYLRLIITLLPLLPIPPGPLPQAHKVSGFIDRAGLARYKVHERKKPPQLAELLDDDIRWAANQKTWNIFMWYLNMTRGCSSDSRTEIMKYNLQCFAMLRGTQGGHLQTFERMGWLFLVFSEKVTFARKVKFHSEIRTETYFLILADRNGLVHFSDRSTLFRAVLRGKVGGLYSERIKHCTFYFLTAIIPMETGNIGTWNTKKASQAYSFPGYIS